MRMYYACCDCGTEIVENNKMNEAIPLEYCYRCGNYEPEVYIRVV